MDDAPPPPVPASFSLKKPLKIAKVVRPPPTAAEAVDVAPVLSDTEEERRFVLKYQALRSGIYKLEATSSLAPLLDVAPLGETLFAFDFDQTLHVRERVRGRALEFLLRVSAAGAPVCIVTAAAPNASSVRAVAAELAELGLDSFFQTTKLDRARALDLVRARWPENEALGKDELQEKMIVLLALLTDRRAADLARIGHSGIKIEQSGAAATYRLQRGPTDWSADLVLQGVPNDVSVCPVACLKAFLERISATRPVPQYKIIDPEVDMPEPIAEMDRLFLSDDNSHVLPRELELLVERVLRQCEYPDFQIAGLLREPCLEVNVSGIQMARYGSLIAAKYNKAEAVEYYLAEHSRCNHVVFVDDNFDNVFGVFLKFAQLEEKHRAAVVGAEKTPRAVTMHSVWYEPPADGKPEVSSTKTAVRNSLLTDALSFQQRCGTAGA